MHPFIPYAVASALFGLGVLGVLRRRNAILLLMSVELMLNAVNLIFVTADATLPKAAPTGQIFTLFVIVIAAAEIGVGLAVVLQLFRLKAAINVDELPLAEPGDDDTGDTDVADAAADKTGVPDVA
ncbi:MAG: NADH-quinone oxidoreductase subunit NuoK [Hamadaea sp.]|uniref:NADH-quinone oxidoreductase subunit NuoK n=1 Tax=Hamadaea sp. TaxID=2024425 RepID=UPI0017AF8D93|nr:NADH-quinone oxidoreductase subunit NuoK [Hamadaea sp.]NUR70584.1 NADH-quinone oxidoreductase subunit NuoK [Hamadaea sp.]NUT19287.1 NADH-quinone oxidoreductase subunit NuoK [Hamadaea sp.]